MPYSVRCKACSAVFAIPDDIWDRRVRGRMATLKCRACKGDIQVDGSKADAGKLSEAPESLPSTPAASEPIASATKPDIATSKASTAVSPAAASPPAVSPHAEPVSVTAAAPVSTVKTEVKPKAVAPSQIAAAETGWSLMPPPAELETVQIPVIPPAALAIPKVVSPPVAEEKPAPAPLIQEKSAQENRAPVAPTPVTVVEPAPAEVPSELWVVSYGDDDDRELTEKQIAAELSRGKINATTIVWREEMPEWLPISGVKELAKYLPNQKPRVAAGKSQATTKTAGTKPATVTPTQKQDAKVAVQPKTATPATTVTTVKQPVTSSPTQKRAGLRESQGDIPPVLAGGTHGGKSVAAKQPDLPPVLAGGLHSEKQNQAKPAPTAAKGPPPLARATQKSSESLGGATEPAALVTQSTGNKPPALPSRGSKAELTEATVPWRKAQESTEEEVLTSAPHIDQVSSPDVPVPAPIVLETAPPETTTPTTPNERTTAQLTPAVFRTTDASPPAIAPEPQSHPSAKASFRPPKPVETATSLVVHTKNAAQAGVHEITDDDFLAMQRRFPKWALPAGIGGGVVVLGLFVYAGMSSDDPPPLPVAPVAVPLNTRPVDGANRPSHQPDLSNVPTTGGVSSASNANGDFASAFAKAAGKSTGNFDAKAAERAASAAIERAAKCRVGSDPTGLLKATVSIAPSGQVTGVQVSPPYATLATGKCVDKALRGFTVKPFQGETASLPLSFNLR